ncbi:MAG: PQQ-binding-like beta-propeller repeat protein [Candidatus Hydrogenedentes bacterium]|nr:PQQ-binding-like beta-propeller repeat protein [Candidatus Hydrogenedentota bacterium]
MTWNTLSFRGFTYRIAALFVAVSVHSFAEDAAPGTDWKTWGGNAFNHKYSSLDQITKDNFRELEVAWIWNEDREALQTIREQYRYVNPAQFKPTPLVVDGMLYFSTSLSQVVALDASTGEVLWEHDPKSYAAGRPANVGFQHRGVAYWSDGDDQRIFIATHDRKLIALNAKTGHTYEEFGDTGTVDLENNLGRPVYTGHLTHSSPPAVVNDTVVVGSIVHDGPIRKEAPPGHVRGFDVRTGRMKWIFHTIPQEGEFGNETWENDSWRYTGATNVWSMMAVDEKLGYVYLPTGTPTNDMYGGHRLGDNLFAESVICLNAETGERVWHFQAVHHGIWDYDFPTAPTLIDITIDGVERHLLAQVSKQAFTYVFDRVTGEPVWPIVERAVDQSKVPGERTSPTQPHPTKPAPFDRQGTSVDQLIDFTPELREQALEIVKGYELGPLFTPQVLDSQSKGTVMLPGPGGGANWPGAAYDPETSTLYIPSATSPTAFTLVKPDAARSNFDYVLGSWNSGVAGPQGLPLFKPPYSRITAIDMKTGEHLWMTPNGDGPVDHPAIKPLNLGALGSTKGQGGPLVTKTLLFVTQRGEGNHPENSKLNVYDKLSGERLGSISLPDYPYGNPVTYAKDGKQYIVIALGGGGFIGGPGTSAKMIALALP